MNKKYIFVTVLALLFSGCVSMSTLQTARVLEENEKEFGFAAYTMTDYTLLIETEEDEDELTSITGGTIEAFTRTSIGKNFDMGVKAYFIGAIVDGKYQFYDGDRFAMALDLGIGYNRLTASDEKITILDLYPTLLMTYDISKNINVTFAPKMIARFISGPTETSTLTGGTMMLKFGRIMPEIGYYVNDTDNITTFGVGIAW